MRDASSFDICISWFAFELFFFWEKYMNNIRGVWVDTKGRHKANKLIRFEYKFFSFSMCGSIFIAIEFRDFLGNSVAV